MVRRRTPDKTAVPKEYKYRGALRLKRGVVRTVPLLHGPSAVCFDAFLARPAVAFLLFHQADAALRTTAADSAVVSRYIAPSRVLAAVLRLHQGRFAASSRRLSLRRMYLDFDRSWMLLQHAFHLPFSKRFFMLRSSGPAFPPTNTHPVRTHRVGAGHSSSCTSVGAAGKPRFSRVLRLARPPFPRPAGFVSPCFAFRTSKGARRRCCRS